MAVGSVTDAMSDVDPMEVPQRRRGVKPRTGSKVCLNIYNLNGMMEFMNHFVLQSQQMGIFHCGVEAHSHEWSFVFILNDGTMRNPLETGVIQCKPRSSPHYTFSESIDLGWTDLSAEQTQRKVLNLSVDWTANSYHVTRRNCLCFAEVLVEELGLGPHFPKWIKNVCNETMKSPKLALLVDTSWECSKWLMKASQHLPRNGLLQCCTLDSCSTKACSGSCSTNTCQFVGLSEQAAKCPHFGRSQHPVTGFDDDALEEVVCERNACPRIILP